MISRHLLDAAYGEYRGFEIAFLDRHGFETEVLRAGFIENDRVFRALLSTGATGKHGCYNC